MQTEAPTSLGHVDHPIDELWDFLHQRGELVHHDDKARRRLRVSRSLEGEEVLGPLPMKEPFPKADFC